MFQTRSYVISIPGSKSRQKSLDTLERLGNKPIVLINERDKNGSRGCFTSHQKAYRLFLDTNDPYCLIFEDDIELINEYDVWPQVQEIMQTTDWDIISLGSHFIENTKVLPNIHKISLFAETHAMLVSRKGAQKIIEWEYRNRPFDLEFHEHNMHSYGIRPTMFMQQMAAPSTGSWHPDVKYFMSSIGFKKLFHYERYLLEHHGLSAREIYIPLFVFIILFCIIARLR